MSRRSSRILAVLGVVFLAAGVAATMQDDGRRWKVHDKNRPQPPMVTPGMESTGERPGTAPSDAIVLHSCLWDLSHPAVYDDPLPVSFARRFEARARLASLQVSEQFVRKFNEKEEDMQERRDLELQRFKSNLRKTSSIRKVPTCVQGH